MKIRELLKSKNINPDESIFELSNTEAIHNLIEMLQEFEIDFDIFKLSTNDLKTLINEYKDCIRLYHTENSHQERGAFLRQNKMLKKYGFSDDDYRILDFC